MNTHTAFASLLAALAGAATAQAQWTVVNIHPAAATDSYTYYGRASQQVGQVYVGGQSHASLWSGTAASWVDLHPAGALESVAIDIDSGTQVGYTTLISGQNVACLWSGTPGSWVNLNPAGVTDGSYVLGISGAQQVGFAVVGGQYHAGTWSGTAASWLDLNPPGADSSSGYSISGVQQFGRATTAGVTHAFLWSGSPGSGMDLNPAGATSSTGARTDGAQQVGSAIFGGVIHAGMWNGTAASWVDLHPAGASESESLGLSNGEQVGYMIDGAGYRASLWSGSSASWVDLSVFVPAGLSDSFADGIWNDASFTYVSGYAYDSGGHGVALLWERPHPPSVVQPPASQAVLAGQPLTLSVSVTGAGPFTYQWSRANTNASGNLSNGGPISGATTAALTIAPTTGSAPGSDGDAGTYTVTVTNAAGSTTSTAIVAVLGAPRTCGSADFNADGDIGTDADIEAFFRVLAGGGC
jgi:hypothetical protein